MANKKKPWQKTLKDYIYQGVKKAVPKRVKKIVKAVKGIKARNIVEGGKRKLEIYKDIPMLDDLDKALAKERLRMDKKTGKIKKLSSLEGIKEGVKKAVADKKKVVEIKTGKPIASPRVPDHGKRKPKPKQKQKSKLKDKLITGTAGVAALGAGAGLYKSGEKMGKYKERQKMHDKDLKYFRKKQQRLKEKSREKKKKPLNLNKKNRGVWV